MHDALGRIMTHYDASNWPCVMRQSSAETGLTYTMTHMTQSHSKVVDARRRGVCETSVMLCHASCAKENQEHTP